MFFKPAKTVQVKVISSLSKHQRNAYRHLNIFDNAQQDAENIQHHRRYIFARKEHRSLLYILHCVLLKRLQADKYPHIPGLMQYTEPWLLTQIPADNWLRIEGRR